MGGFTDLVRKNNFTRLTFFGIGLFLWIGIYILLIVPLMNNYYLGNPQASQVGGFLINIGFIFISIFLLAFMLDGIMFALKFATGMTLDVFGLVLIQSPLCLSPKTGEILLSSNNASCSWAMDIFFSNFFKALNITGYPLYLLTYWTFGFILMMVGGILLFFTIKKKMGLKSTQIKI